MSRLRHPSGRLLAAALATAVLAALLAGARAGAQTELGIAPLSNSGQVGTVSLFAAGSATRVAVRIIGAQMRREPVSIERGGSCAQLGGRAAFRLTRLSGAGFSSSTVHATIGRLRSGPFYLVVLSSTARSARPVACGHLF